MNTSTLARFPQEIATLSYEVVNIGTKIRDLRSAIADIEAEIDSAITFGDFKNDAQRKAAKAQMLKEHDSFGELSKELQSLAEVQAMTEINLALIKNRFSIAKLEARERIAKLESLAA
ncbi:MAG: hypothetical protein IM596_07910 [Pseudanabaena sp. M051S1SP2A07QC]|nr:hypothetical protein [Pseudanabaena sp. M109S1SP2A07QC]MCA6521767.1 hypothetical protein [Pseudanabaena sp. M051S1SP2A07QC]